MKKIYLVAPSFGCSNTLYKQRLEKSILNMSKYFEIIKGQNIFLNEGFINSNTLENQKKELDKAFLSDADIIYSVGGGELQFELLNYINFKKYKNKIFCGYSDNTNIIFVLTTIYKQKCIYTSNFASFYMDELKYTEYDTLRMINNETKFIGYLKYQSIKSEQIFPEYTLDKNKVITAVNFESEEGILLGGCIDSLKTLCGTKFDKMKKYKKENIFLLEACDLNALDIRRSILQFYYAGWFKKTKAILIGRFINNYDLFGYSYIELIRNLYDQIKIPMLLDIDLGHINPQLPFYMGKKAKITFINKNIIVEYKQ